MDPANEAMPYLKEIPETNIQNRMEHPTAYGNRVIIKNYTPTCNHVAPLESKL